MAYRLSELLKGDTSEQVMKNGAWLPARWIQLGPFRRLRDAILVLRGKAEAVIWE